MDTIYCTSDLRMCVLCYIIKKDKSFADYDFCVHRMVLDIPEYDFGRRLLSMVYPLGNGVLYHVAGRLDDSGSGFCKNMIRP